MPVRYEIDQKLETTFTYYCGKVTQDEVLAHVRARRADPRYRPHFRTLIDCSGAMANLRFGDTSKVAEFCHSHSVPPATGRMAFYVPEQKAVYGTLRQLQVLLEPQNEVRVFTDLAEARTWLGLPAA